MLYPFCDAVLFSLPAWSDITLRIKGSLEMDVLATCRADPVLLAVALAALLSACDSSTSVHASSTATAPVKDALSAHDPSARTDAPADASPALPSTARGVGADIARFVPNDAMIRMEKRGDLDGDGDPDVLLVLQEKPLAESAPRTLMILRGVAGGSFEKAIENPDAILCQSCGGMMGDPLSDVNVNADGFALIFEGGSRELWSRTYSFAYSKTEGDWHLERIDVTVLDRIDGHDEESHATRETIGVVSIRDFDAASMARNQDI
jgi:hypothetical protein